MQNYLTFKQLDSQCIKAARISLQKIAPKTRQTFINHNLMALYATLDGINDPWYNRVAALTVGADQESLRGDVVTALDYANKTITRGSGVFTAGSIITVALLNDGAGQIDKQFVGRITVGGATATFEVISGAGASYPTASYVDIGVGVIKSLSDTSIDLSSLYIKDIKQVYDEEGGGGAVRGYYLYTDAWEFRTAQHNVDNSTEVLAYHHGDTLDLYQGADAEELGNPMMEYRGKPNVYTDATEDNTIDLPPEQNKLLMNMIVIDFLKAADKPVPGELQAEVDGDMNKLVSAAAGDEAKKK